MSVSILMKMICGITFGQVWLIKCQPWLWKEMITKATKNQFNFHMLILLHQMEQNKGWKKIQDWFERFLERMARNFTNSKFLHFKRPQLYWIHGCRHGCIIIKIVDYSLIVLDSLLGYERARVVSFLIV